MTSRDRVWWLVVVSCLLLAVALASKAFGSSERPPTVEGKPVSWWAAKAKQARKDANARAATVRRLRLTMEHDPSVQESIRLATIAYPGFTAARAWAIIRHESWMVRDPIHAYNRSSGASGLFQFLPSTFAATPYGKAGLSIWSPYAQAMAAGYLHQLGDGCVHWDIDC
jgi:hypothetical protein